MLSCCLISSISYTVSTVAENVTVAATVWIVAKVREKKLKKLVVSSISKQTIAWPKLTESFNDSVKFFRNTTPTSSALLYDKSIC